MGCSDCGTFPCSYCPYSSLEKAIGAREAREEAESYDDYIASMAVDATEGPARVEDVADVPF